jgi:hypothetical protein
MNGPEPKIEIYKPFGEAFELMKKILFQPFDLTKWLVIGFAAFLANLSGGFNFNFPTNWDRRSWGTWSGRDLASAVHQLPDWARQTGFIAVVIVLVLTILLVLAWLSSRGRFIFTDCIVKNRGAIVVPWREFRKEGNSFFLFSLLIALGFILIAALLALAIFIPAIRHGKEFTHLHDVLTISGIVFVALIVFVLALAWALISHFVLPVMYRRRCRAREAFKIVASLIAAYPGEIVLYCLFFFVLAIAAAVIGCVAICVTCCIAAIPYVGTVILLPVFVVLRAFSFCFLRQFGPDYDVWQGVPQPEPIAISPPPPSIPPTPPPLQT